jgi:hypothetical protein
MPDPQAGGPPLVESLQLSVQYISSYPPYLEAIVMGWMTKVQFLVGTKEISLLHSIQTCSEAHPASYPMGTRGLSLRHDADHSPPSSAQVKNDAAVPPFPHTPSWHGTWFIEHRENFAFYRKFNHKINFGLIGNHLWQQDCRLSIKWVCHTSPCTTADYNVLYLFCYCGSAITDELERLINTGFLDFVHRPEFYN